MMMDKGLASEGAAKLTSGQEATLGADRLRARERWIWKLEV